MRFDILAISCDYAGCRESDCVWMLSIIQMGLLSQNRLMDRIFQSVFHLRICKIMNPCLCLTFAG